MFWTGNSLISGGLGGAASPSAAIAGPMRLSRKASNWARDSQKSSTPQPSLIGPPAWKISPSGGSASTLISALTASYCSAVASLNLMLSPIAIVELLLGRDTRQPSITLRRLIAQAKAPPVTSMKEA